MSELTEEAIVERLREKFGDRIKAAEITGPRRVFVTVDPPDYKEVVRFIARDLGLVHVQTITGVDYPDEKRMEIMVHMGRRITVTVRTSIPREKPEIDTITDVVPGSSVHEREVHDLLGVVFKGNPNLTRILLPEDWPEGIYPLRKDVPLEEIRAKPLRGEREA